MGKPGSSDKPLLHSHRPDHALDRSRQTANSSRVRKSQWSTKVDIEADRTDQKPAPNSSDLPCFELVQGTDRPSNGRLWSILSAFIGSPIDRPSPALSSASNPRSDRIPLSPNRCHNPNQSIASDLIQNFARSADQAPCFCSLATRIGQACTSRIYLARAA